MTNIETKHYKLVHDKLDEILISTEPDQLIDALFKQHRNPMDQEYFFKEILDLLIQFKVSFEMIRAAERNNES